MAAEVVTHPPSRSRRVVAGRLTGARIRASASADSCRSSSASPGTTFVLALAPRLRAVHRDARLGGESAPGLRGGPVVCGGDLLPGRHLGPLQSCRDPRIRSPARDRMDDRRGLLRGPDRGRDLRLVPRLAVLRDRGQPRAHGPPARAGRSGDVLRGHPHLRPGPGGPWQANGPKLNTRFIPLGAAAYIVAAATIGGPDEGAR